MRYSAVDPVTNQAIAAQDVKDPSKVKYMFLPRIRCLDCPGRVYSAGPGMGVENFEVHLKNKLHREKIDGKR